MEGLATALLNIHDALGFPSDPSLISNAVPHITKTYALIFFFFDRIHGLVCSEVHVPVAEHA
jgi:hypothetical protein